MLLFWHASLNFCLCFFLMLLAFFISSFVVFCFLLLLIAIFPIDFSMAFIMVCSRC